VKIVLWDTRKLDASKDFAGGMGVGMWPAGGGLRGRLVRYFYTRDRRPVALLYAHLAAIFTQLGHRVRYVEDRIPTGAALYLFAPSLTTLHLERQAIAAVRAANPAARVLGVGTVASVLPEAFESPGVTVIRGEAEQLLWKLDEVLQRPEAVVHLGALDDLDRLPHPDWSPFGPRRFRISYDFWKFPTALVQASRGCSLRCNYCPYIVLENSVRRRNPEAVVDEIRHDVRRWGFRSFKFRDPLFGTNREHVLQLAELILRLERPIQFSIETRIDLMRPEILRVLKRAGLTSITVGIESPDDSTLRHYDRRPIGDDRQRAFVALCRSMGIRTVAGFLIGFPGDTVASIRAVGQYAKLVGPTFANFNIVTPYPGTEFFQQVKERIVTFDYSRYSVFTPVLRGDHLTPEQIADLHQWCARRYYFRWDYLRENAHLLWPGLQRFGLGRPRRAAGEGDSPHPTPPRPLGAGDPLAQKGFRQDAAH